MAWKPMRRDLVNGDLIRTVYEPGTTYYMYRKKEEPFEVDKEGRRVHRINLMPDRQFKPKYPTIMYAIATGGFGMSMSTMGNAIFANHISDNKSETKNRKSPWSSRWERYWGIEVWD